MKLMLIQNEEPLPIASLNMRIDLGLLGLKDISKLKDHHLPEAGSDAADLVRSTAEKLMDWAFNDCTFCQPFFTRKAWKTLSCFS